MHTFYFPRDDVKAALRNYSKNKTRFIAARPNAESAEKEFQKAYDHLVAVLKDEAIRGPIEMHLRAVLPEDLQIAIDREFVTFESQVINSIAGLPAKTSEMIVLAGLETFNDGKRISSAEALMALLAQSHNEIIEKTKVAREWSRKEKKRRKRQILASSGYISTGVVAIFGNVFGAAGAMFMVPSIGAGAGAVVKGSADLYSVL